MNIIRAEIYKLRSSKTYLNINLLIMGLSVTYAVYLKFFTNTTGKEFVEKVLPEKMELVLVISLLFSFIYLDEYRYNTIKNQISIIGNRNRLYLAKAVFQFAITLLSYAVAAGIFIIVYLVLPKGENDKSGIIAELLVFLAGFVVVLLRALALINFLSILTKSYLIVSLFFIVFSNLINLFLSLVGVHIECVGKLIKYTLQTETTTLMKTVQNGEVPGFLIRNIVVVVVIYGAVCIGNHVKYR